jgi:toxin-antitoxin system PIN domain toxin
VILVDANILVYAQINSLSQHEATRAWLDRQLNGTARVGLPWSCVLAYLRISTNPRIFGRPVPIVDAWRQVLDWLALDVVWIPQPTERHTEFLGQLLALPGVSGNLVQDAHLAALAMEHGLMLCSADGDFARFPGLRWLNPLAP